MPAGRFSTTSDVDSGASDNSSKLPLAADLGGSQTIGFWLSAVIDGGVVVPIGRRNDQPTVADAPRRPKKRTRRHENVSMSLGDMSDLNR
jgi:hypothetical protein